MNMQKTSCVEALMIAATLTVSMRTPRFLDLSHGA
jgi:hypothetical protein